jgi:hypothetical protein
MNQMREAMKKVTTQILAMDSTPEKKKLAGKNVSMTVQALSSNLEGLLQQGIFYA